jgi:photosystem II stability/assembly factor-like uncharacterized protein
MLFSVAAIAAVLMLGLANAAAGRDANDTRWRPLRIGGGGFVTGLDISPDGSTRVVRTDTYGAYIWDLLSSQWRQLVTAASMPPGDVSRLVGNADGCYEIRVAPSLPARIYMAYLGNIYRSDNRGDTWIRTGFATKAMPANDKHRLYGPKMAVDPANPDVVYVSTVSNGVFVTADGGATWSAVAAIPVAAAPGSIVFDAASGAASGKTKRIYVGSSGNGVYASEDAGSAWTRTSGGPKAVAHAVVSPDGLLYVTDVDGSDRNAWSFAPGSGVWSNLSATSSWSRFHSIAVDPADPKRIILGTEGGSLTQSLDGGATWTNYTPWSPSGAGERAAADIPWLAWTNETWMSNGDMRFDPVQPNLLWFAEGIGVWHTTPPRTHTAYIWRSQTYGIEQLVANEIVSPPGGNPLAASWDRAVFLIGSPDVFPSSHGPSRDAPIRHGWALDYASADPAFIAGVFNLGASDQSGYSADGGRTWTPFPALPSGSNAGGGIAASTSANFVWAPSNNGTPSYTKDRGATWTRIVLPGAPATGDTGWGWAYYLDRHIVTADRVRIGVFYMYNSLKGLYRSVDGGATWSLVKAGEIAPFSGFNAKLRSVPGHAGHLFFTSGQQGSPTDRHPAQNPFMRSTNGGETWSPVFNVREVYAFGFGAAKPGAAYPSIYIAGWVENVWGIWRSTDNAQTWARIGDFPLNSLDGVKTVEGDANTYGTVYIGFGGSGYAYGAMYDPRSDAPHN